MKITEIFQSIQGEGPDMGRRAIFVRLHGCNLACTWCDTKYAWSEANFYELTTQQVLDWIHRTPEITRVIFTGGEPLLQLEELTPLIQSLREDGRHVAVETNGTIIPPDLSIFDLIVVSPKGLDTANKWLEIIRNNQHVKLKFVVHQKNIEDILSWIKDYHVRDVYLMPIGSDAQSIISGSVAVFDRMIEYNLECIVSPRMHILVGIK